MKLSQSDATTWLILYWTVRSAADQVAELERMFRL